MIVLLIGGLRWTIQYFHARVRTLLKTSHFVTDNGTVKRWKSHASLRPMDSECLVSPFGADWLVKIFLKLKFLSKNVYLSSVTHRIVTLRLRSQTSVRLRSGQASDDKESPIV